MQVGGHEAIHGVGHQPSTMNSGAQAITTFCEVNDFKCVIKIHWISINPKKERRLIGTQ